MTLISLSMSRRYYQPNIEQEHKEASLPIALEKMNMIGIPLLSPVEVPSLSEREYEHINLARAKIAQMFESQSSFNVISASALFYAKKIDSLLTRAILHLDIHSKMWNCGYYQEAGKVWTDNAYNITQNKSKIILYAQSLDPQKVESSNIWIPQYRAMDFK